MSDRDRQARRTLLSRLGELFDASALGLVTLLLLVASFFATWRGMRDFIASRELAAGAVSQGLVFLIVATLSLAMYVALREMVAPYFVRGWWSAVWKRILAGILYSVLALWSVGFGYGFWWSLVAGQTATEAGLQRSVVSIRTETSDVRARLSAAGSVMASARALSDLKAEQEAARGGTCGVNSPPGEGPLARARGETQTQIAALAISVKEDWQEPLGERLAGLDADLAAVLGREDSIAPQGLQSSSRKAQFEALGRKVQIAARDIGADATARGRTLATQLRAKADQLSVPPEQGRVSYCYDPDLAASLRAAADEMDQTYEIETVPFRFAEGADGVARAIEDLVSRAVHMAGLGGQAKPGGLGGRDLIALLAAIGVDLALLVFGLLRGSGTRRERASQRGLNAGDRAGAVIAPAAPEKLASDQSRALPAPSEDKLASLIDEDAGTDEIIDAEFAPVADTSMIETFEPEPQLDPQEHIADLMQRVESLVEGVAAATLAVERSPLQNMLNDTLRELRKHGYSVTGSSDKVYNETLHKIVGTAYSHHPEGYILRIARPGFLDANGRLREKAFVIISLGPDTR